MLLAIMGLIIPAIFSFSTETEREISLEISIILLAVYGLSVLFTLTQGIVPQEDPEWKMESLQHPSKEKKASLKAATGWLLVLAILLSVMSEVLTEVLDPAASTMGFSATFTGIFLLAPIGGAAELINAVRFARKNQLDVALASSIGSSIQTALLAAPILVFAGLVMGQPMNLLFGQFQVVAIILAVVAINNTLSVGSVRWMAGIKLIAIYLMLGVGFYYQP
jgi:Ca2+:H+ antiporter